MGCFQLLRVTANFLVFYTIKNILYYTILYYKEYPGQVLVSSGPPD